MTLVDIFRKLLAERVGSQSLTVSMWNDGTRMSNHLLEVAALPVRFHAKGPPSNDWLAMLAPEMDEIAPPFGDAASVLSAREAHAPILGQKLPDRTKLASNRRCEVSTPPQLTVFYVKVSTGLPGTWGLTQKKLDRLSALRVRWFCVFLHQRATIGYLFSGHEILMRVNDASLIRRQDGDYYLNQRAQFMLPQRFESIDALVSRAF